MRNRHSADQLAEVRKDLEDLKAKKKFLRTLLLETRDFRERSGEPTRRSAPSRGWIALPQSSGGELLEPFHVTQTYPVRKLVRVIGTMANGFPARMAS